MRLLAAAVLLLSPLPAHADVLIDNVVGLTLDEKGAVEEFNAVLVGEDGRIEQVLQRRDKRPGKVDYRMDGKGRVLVPGLIDSHVSLMALGLALLQAEAGFEKSPGGEPRPEDRDLALVAAQKLLLASGVTTVADIGTSIDDWQAYRRAGDSGALRIRIVAYAAGVRDMALIGGSRPSPWLYRDRLKQNGLALVLDGPLKTHEAWLKAPYADMPGKRGTGRMSDIQLRNLMSRAAIDNFQVAVTAHGDAAVAAVLDALDELAQTYSGDRRWRLEGLDLVDAAELARLGQYGVVASVQPRRLAGDRASADALLGPERQAGLHRWRSLADTTTGLVFGSAAVAAAPRPFADMAAAITRQDDAGEPFGGWQPQEKLVREAAFAAYTTQAARALFAEGRLGRIAEGQRADFLLIDRDPFLAAPDQLREVRVLQTWVGGEMVYEAEGQRPAESR